jgi:hypothetical protein
VSIGSTLFRAARMLGRGVVEHSATGGNEMPRLIRTAMLIVSIIGVVTALVRRFGPRLREYSAASQTFWSNPKVIKAREKAWDQARRRVGDQTAGSRA